MLMLNFTFFFTHSFSSKMERDAFAPDFSKKFKFENFVFSRSSVRLIQYLLLKFKLLGEKKRETAEREK